MTIVILPPLQGAPDDQGDWTRDEVQAIYEQPFIDLLLQAQPFTGSTTTRIRFKCHSSCRLKPAPAPKTAPTAHRQESTTSTDKEKLAAIEAVVEQAKAAKASGATRFCMGAAWREPPSKAMPVLTAMVSQVKALGLETCMTLGMLDNQQATTLAEAGLDYYNHNLDTSPEHYGNIITTRTYGDRLETLAQVRNAGMKVCSGGILGLDETQGDRIGLLHSLATLPQHPDSVPINQLAKVAGTPLEDAEDLDPLDFVRVIATARIVMPECRRLRRA